MPTQTRLNTGLDPTGGRVRKGYEDTGIRYEQEPDNWTGGRLHHRYNYVTRPKQGRDRGQRVLVSTDELADALLDAISHLVSLHGVDTPNLYKALSTSLGKRMSGRGQSAERTEPAAQVTSSGEEWDWSDITYERPEPPIGAASLFRHLNKVTAEDKERPIIYTDDELDRF
jgi:hypothetical protein